MRTTQEQIGDRRRFLTRAAFTLGGLSLGACADPPEEADGAFRDGVTTPNSAAPATPVTTPPSAVAPTQPASASGTPQPPAAYQPATVAEPAPIPVPSWLAGVPLYKWVEIPGTVHAGSPAAPQDDPMNLWCGSNNRLAFCGAALKGTELFLAASGGHDDYSGNEVTSIDIGVEQPRWRLRHGSTAAAQRVRDAAYYADGKPTSRHTYWSSHYSKYHHRVFLFGCRAAYGSGGYSARTLDGFNPDTDTWDPAGTWPENGSIHCMDSDGNGWGVGTNSGGFSKWTKETARSTTLATHSPPGGAPLAFDSKRGRLFSVAWGSGEDLYGTSANAYVFGTNGTRTAIGFNPSPAWTRWQEDRTEYGALEYDPDNDWFLSYDGRDLYKDERDKSATPRMGRIYVFKPNESNIWDVGILPLDPGSMLPAGTLGAGVLNRFRYVPALKGFVLMARGTSPLYFIRTA